MTGDDAIVARGGPVPLRTPAAYADAIQAALDGAPLPAKESVFMRASDHHRQEHTWPQLGLTKVRVQPRRVRGRPARVQGGAWYSHVLLRGREFTTAGEVVAALRAMTGGRP